MQARLEAAELALAESEAREAALADGHARLLAGQADAFRAAINGVPLDETLDILSQGAREQFGGGVRCVFYMVEPSGTQLQRIAGNSDPTILPVDGYRVARDALGCGLAMYTGDAVITPDVRQDPKWEGWLWLAEKHNYRALWCFPIAAKAMTSVAIFALYFDLPRQPAARDLDIVNIVTGAASIIISQHQEIADRQRAEEEVRGNEERRAFLLALSEVLRPLADPSEIEGVTAQRLAEHFAASNVNYASVEMDNGAEYYVVRRDFAAQGRRSIRGRYRFENYPAVGQHLRTGQTMTSGDISRDPRLSEDDRALYAANDISSFAVVPLIKASRLAAILAVHDSRPRHWTDADLSLLTEVADRTWVAIERARSEGVLRESEVRQAFLLKLSDALGLIDNDDAMKAMACKLISEHLCVHRVTFCDIKGDEENFIASGTHADGLPPLELGTPVAFGEDIVRRLRAGDLVVSNDVKHDSRLLPRERQQLLASGVAAFILVLLSRQGRGVAALALQHGRAREWNTAEIGLARDAAERVCEAAKRSHAEAALRESEGRFRQFAEASSGALWIRDAVTLAMEYVSPSISKIYGVEIEAFLGDMSNWVSMIIPEDRESAIGHIECALNGEPAVHEFRIQRANDHVFRWIRNIDFPLRDAQGNIQRVGGIAEDVTEAKQLAQHQSILLAELQHRVRNIMAMIRSMTNRTATGVESVDEYRNMLSGRLMALARVQALLTRQANTGGSLKSVVESEIGAQAHHDGQYVLSGPDIMLSPKAVEVLTLAFHELATNALKYGALSSSGGRVSVRWSTSERRGKPWLILDWIEEGVASREHPTRRGFGSDLIEGKIPYELGGKGKLSIEASGARCHLELPLREAESILETDAPMPATVFGGVLDMSEAADLTGRRVLVVDDDYFMASDTAAALRSAGANVLGPCPSEDPARKLVETASPTAAVVDLNLGGGGPKFEIAYLLKARGIPFVFVTGYDAGVIPPDLASFERLQKPVQLRSIVDAIGALPAPSPAS